MTFLEKKWNLFEVPDDYFFAHCISADYEFGAGIAVEFQRKFHLKSKLNQIGRHVYPDSIQIGRVFNLVTKAKYWNKPTYDSLTGSLELLKQSCLCLDIQKLAMPKIGCGLDRLQWAAVRDIIQQVFANVSIEILVCYL